jgi:hypothetical protein
VAPECSEYAIAKRQKLATSKATLCWAGSLAVPRRYCIVPCTNRVPPSQTSVAIDAAIVSPPLLMVPFEIDTRTSKLHAPYVQNAGFHVERCRGRKELAPEMRFEKVDH